MLTLPLNLTLTLTLTLSLTLTVAQVVTCYCGSLDLGTIGRGCKATEALAEGRRQLAAAKDDEAKAAVQAAIDIVEAKARPCLGLGLGLGLLVMGSG